MKTTIITSIMLLSTLLGFSTNKGNSEGEIEWSKYKPEAKSKWVFLTESYELEEYNEVMGTLQWFYHNAPDINVSLYQMGNEILSNAEKNESDVTHKQVLRDSIIWSYENRVKYFGDAANVYDREGTVAFNYLFKKRDEDAHLYKLYTDIYKLKGDEMYVQNGKNYFNSAILMYSHKKIKKAEVIEVFEKVEAYYNHAKELYASNPTTIKFIDATIAKDAQIFEKYIKLNCSEIESIYGAKYNESKDLELAKKINTKMRGLISKGEKECMNSSLFLNTLNTIQDAEPSAENSLLVAKVYLDMKENEKAYTALEKAIELSTDSVEISSVHMNLAQLDAAKGKNVSARSHAVKSIKFDSENAKQAYTLIGDMYMGAQSCNSDDFLQNKAKFIAAYNMYKKAGASTKAAQAKKYFPETKDLFNRNKSVGDSQATGCWIGETIKLMVQ